MRYLLPLVLLLLCSVSSAETKTVTAGAEADLVSKYLCRGLNLSTGMAMQPSAWIAAHDFTFTVWNNYMLTEKDRNLSLDSSGREKTLSEIDLTLAYGGGTLGNLQISPSFVYYAMQTVSPNYGEFWVKFSYPVWLLTLSSTQVVSAFGSPDTNGQYYGDLAAAYERELTADLKLKGTLSTAVATSKFNRVNAGVEGSGFENVIFDLQFPWNLSPAFYIRPHLTFSSLIENNVRTARKNDCNDDTDTESFSAGIAVGANF